MNTTNANAWEIGPCAEIILCVRDVERVAELYTQVFEYECVDNVHRFGGMDAGLASFWNVPRSTEIKQVLLKYHAAENAKVRLVQFNHLPEKQAMMRSGHNLWDSGGVFGLDVRVQNTALLYETLIARGFHGINEPLRYTIDKFTVFEALLKGHDEIGYGIIQRLQPPLPEPPTRPLYEGTTALEALEALEAVTNVSSPPILVLCPVPDMDESVRFFTEVLGFRVVMESTFVQNTEPAPSVLGLPHNLSHTVNTAITLIAPTVPPNGEREGVIELVQMRGVKGRDFSERCTPPNFGVMAVRYPVRVINAYFEAVQERGASIDKPLTDIIIDTNWSQRRARAFAMRSPSGIRLEFVEYLEREHTEHTKG
jgi:catechol 2,3-dioxygenase-like lactoylglutathione lyase family enzyme